MERTRVEDLGVINEKLKSLVERFENNFPYFESKHSYEGFENKMQEDGNLIDLHTGIRFLIEELWEIWSIAHGDVPE